MDSPVAFYNEIDPYAAQWLRNLIEEGHIAPGIVDERSIEDIRPDELVGYTQCHFFAGIGVWSLALRSAGWPDNRPVWTGSCPCQPFSAAGEGAGFADERHLWPAFNHLIEQCRPPVVLGEQVASKAVDAWIDLVHADLEALGYAFGGVPFPSAGVGAPHIRDRLFWVANSVRTGSLPSSHAGVHRSQKGAGARDGEPKRLGSAIGMAYAADERFERGRAGKASDGGGSSRLEPERLCDAGRMAYDKLQQRPDGESRLGVIHDAIGRHESAAAVTGLCGDMRPGPTNGFWRDADWLGCRDGKWRPVEPGSFPLAHGATSRVGRLRAYGNAINAKAAEVFIGSFMEVAHG